jgi:hypothetical protein
MSNQRWELGKSRWRSDRETIRTSEYEVARIPSDQARAFVEAHHYSKDWPAARYPFGLHRHGTLVGVAVYSQPVNNRTVTNVFPIHPKEGIELGRLVLLDEVPGNGESWFVSRTFGLLRKELVMDREGRELRGILGVVSFSDPMPRRTSSGEIVMPGHWGCVYQSLSAVHIGRSDARILRLFQDGTVFNHRTETKVRNKEVGWRGGVEELCAHGAGEPPGDTTTDLQAWLSYWLPKITRPFPHRGNLKYAWAFDGRLRKQMPTALPYPKSKDPEVA